MQALDCFLACNVLPLHSELAFGYMVMFSEIAVFFQYSSWVRPHVHFHFSFPQLLPSVSFRTNNQLNSVAF